MGAVFMDAVSKLVACRQHLGIEFHLDWSSVLDNWFLHRIGHCCAPHCRGQKISRHFQQTAHLLHNNGLRYTVISRVLLLAET